MLLMLLRKHLNWVLDQEAVEEEGQRKNLTALVAAVAVALLWSVAAVGQLVGSPVRPRRHNSFALRLHIAEPRRLDHILARYTALQPQQLGHFDNQLFRIEQQQIAAGPAADKHVAWTLVVERNNTVEVERIGLDIDTAAVAVDVIVLVDTHTDSFSAAINAKNQKDAKTLNHFRQNGDPCESFFMKMRPGLRA